ncbi:MAG: HTH domain-containing protein [Eubacteriales bacterium]
MQSALDRRQTMLEILCDRKFDTLDNLAMEFGVSKMTVRRDITLLSRSAPIYTTQGKGGGVHVAKDYSLRRRRLKAIQKTCLIDLIPRLSEDEQAIVKSIISEYG